MRAHLDWKKFNDPNELVGWRLSPSRREGYGRW